MKLNQQAISSVILLLLPSCCFCFITPNPINVKKQSQLQMSFIGQPSAFNPIESLSSILLSDEVADAAANVAATITDPATQDAAAEAAQNNGGWFGFLTLPIEFLLQVIHSLIAGAAGSMNAWGISIILMTVFIKVVTYPLTKQQLESTNKMQVLQPRIKEIQAKYASNPEVMNQKVAEVYQTEQVNPLAGCIPSLIQLPVFIGLYRAVLNLAKDDKLDEPFLWLPNLEGPVYGADPTTGSDWILKGWENGVPTLGWHDTLAFLTIPVILVISQFLSMQIMQPKTDDPAQEQAQLPLKFLPLLIGWFSLNVPAALGIYWVANNFITTAITLQIRSGLETVPVSTSASTAAAEDFSRAFTPSPAREKPSGFGRAEASMSDDEIKPITAPIDAEIIEEVDEVETEVQATTVEEKKRGGKKKKKRSKK